LCLDVGWIENQSEWFQKLVFQNAHNTPMAGRMGGRKINFSVVFASQLVGLREVADQVWQVSFMEYDLGYFDEQQDRVEPGPNPFAPDKVSTMCPE
jgi:hypothetical protein